MSNITFALAAVSAVVVGVGLFSAIWYHVEKLQAEQAKSKEFYGAWDLLKRPTIRVQRAKTPSGTAVGRVLETTHRGR
jgi:hypothetical protein